MFVELKNLGYCILENIFENRLYNKKFIVVY